MLAKTLRPLPEKWHGLQDIEARYRQRYLDLLTNEHSRAVFEKRIAIVRETRRFFEERGFVEVETPILQTMAGGAAAEPFKTRHNALGIDLYLRIALELYLKRLLVGGFNKVFEINRNFRNEGISRKHNPEFTMLEAYWAYADFEKMANLVEELICHLAEKICGSLTIEHRDTNGNVTRTINLKRPWRRVRYRDLMREVAGKDWFELSPEQRRGRAMNEFKLEILPQLADFEVTQHVFEKLIEEKTIDPLFVTHCPKELVPLAKQNVEDSSLVDVFELVINGAEIAPRVQRAERSARATPASTRTGRRRKAEHRRGISARSRARYAACWWHRNRDRQAHNAAHRRRIHPRRDSISFAATEKAVAVAV